MPSTRRELKMQCGGCDGGEKCIDLPRLLRALRGLSQETCDRATEEFELRSCGNGRRLPTSEIGPLCVQVLIAKPVRGQNGLSDLQSKAAKAAEKMIRVRMPRAEDEDVRQTAMESAYEILQPPGRIIERFDIDRKTRTGAPASISAFVTQAVAWDALARLRGDLGVERIASPAGYTYEDPFANTESIDLIGDDAEASTEFLGIGLNGAIKAGLPVAAQDGHPIDYFELLEGDFEALNEADVDAGPLIAGVRAHVLELQHKTFEKLVHAIPAKGNEGWYVTARVLKAAVELDSAFFPRGLNGDIVGRLVARAADHSNVTLWYRRHVLPLLEQTARREPAVAAALRELCDRLDGLASLYARFPDDAPAPGPQSWSTKVFHVAARADLRAILSS